MRETKLLVRLLLLFICGAAQAQTPQPPVKARVSGRVTNPTGETLRRAVVRLLGKESYKQTVDANGGFALEGIAPGSYVLIVQRTGYSAQKYGASTPLIRDCFNAEQTSIKPEDVAALRQCAARAPGTVLSLKAGAELTNIAIKLTPLGYISGRVTNQDGEPVPAWQVQPMQAVFENGKRRLQTRGGGRTDADGYYSIGNLLPGKYILRAYNLTGSMFAGLNTDRQGKAETEAERTTYYPGSGDPAEASSVDVGSGAELTGMDIRLLRKRVYTISGKVDVPPGTAVGDQILNLNVSGQRRAVMNFMTAIVRPDGTFEFRGVDPGTYVISGSGVLTRPGIPPPDPFTGQMEATVTTADVAGLKMTVGTGATAVAVAGMVVSEGTKPPTSPTVLLNDPDSTYGNPAAAPDSTGAFRFERKFPRSKYTVNMQSLPAGFFVKSIRYGRQDALHNMLDLTGGDAAILDIVLASKVAVIEGDVADAMPGVVIAAWPRIPIAATDGGVKFTSPDQNGKFEITDLAPGSYYVVAFDDLDPGLLRDADFLARFNANAANVSLEEGGRTSADAKVIPREQVAAEIAKLP